jgi:hypothetical protein
VHVEKVADIPAAKRTPGPDLAWSLALVAAAAAGLAWRRRRPGA